MFYSMSKNTVMRMILCLAGESENTVLLMYTDIRALLQANTQERWVRLAIRHAQSASRVRTLPSSTHTHTQYILPGC